MKRMKRLACLLATVAMVLGILRPVKAEYLPREQDWELEVDNSSNSSAQTGWVVSNLRALQTENEA